MNSSADMRKPLRILCVIETLGRGGGAEQLVFSLAFELRKLSVEVEFVDLCSWHDDLGLDLQAMRFKVHRLNIGNRWNLLRGMAQLCQVLMRGQFDLVWAHGFLGNLYGQLVKMIFFRIPSIVTLHSEGYSEAPPKSLFSKFAVAAEGWLNSRANARVGVSRAVAKDYQSFFGWHDIDVIYNGVPTSNIPASISDEECRRLRRDYDIDPMDFLIVVPARLVKKKGHIYLLQALEILSASYDAYPKVLFLANEGGERETLERYMSSHKLSGSVQIKKCLLHPKLFELILAADAVVLPSLREPFGIAAAEAMTTGTPVVLTRVDGIMELVGDSECALMVQPANPRELADAIIKLMRNPAFAAGLGTKGRKRMIDNFDIEFCAAAWRDEFLRVIKNE